MQASIPQHVLDFLGQNKTLTLATTAGGEPHAATLLYVNDGVRLYIWTKHGSATGDQLQDNPRAAFAIDEYSDDFSKTRGLQGVGDVSPVSGDGMATAAGLFGDKFPDLSPGGSTASITFFQIDPSELQFIGNSEKGGDEFGFNYSRDRVYTSEMPAQGGDAG